MQCRCYHQKPRFKNAPHVTLTWLQNVLKLIFFISRQNVLVQAACFCVACISCLSYDTVRRINMPIGMCARSSDTLCQIEIPEHEKRKFGIELFSIVPIFYLEFTIKHRFRVIPHYFDHSLIKTTHSLNFKML